MSKEEQDMICSVLRESIAMLCKSGLTFVSEIKLQGVIGITVDDDHVFILHMDQKIPGDPKDVTLCPSRTAKISSKRVALNQKNSYHVTPEVKTESGEHLLTDLQECDIKQEEEDMSEALYDVGMSSNGQTDINAGEMTSYHPGLYQPPVNSSHTHSNENSQSNSENNPSRTILVSPEQSSCTAPVVRETYNMRRFQCRVEGCTRLFTQDTHCRRHERQCHGYYRSRNVARRKRGMQQEKLFYSGAWLTEHNQEMDGISPDMGSIGPGVDGMRSDVDSTSQVVDEIQPSVNKTDGND